MDELEINVCHETKQLIWENKIPVIVKLSLEEINNLDSPPNFIVSLKYYPD